MVSNERLRGQAAGFTRPTYASSNSDGRADTQRVSHMSGSPSKIVSVISDAGCAR
jgi:hypothetical protein